MTLGINTLGINTSERTEIEKLANDCHLLIRQKDENRMTELIVEYILKNNFIHTTKNDLKEEVWIYNGGIYIPNGMTSIKEITRDILGCFYTAQRASRIIAKIETDTYIEEDKFFNINYKEEIPVKNGILNVVTLKLDKFNPNKIFFAKLPVEYKAGAKCILIDKFLSDILRDKEDIIVAEEIAGYGLYKENFLESAVMLSAAGRNGKGKYIVLLKKLYGEKNVCSITLGRLNEESFSLSEMFGKLANLAGDFTTNVIKDTGIIKSIVGRDMIGAKRKFLRDIFFVPYTKQIFACNELPKVYDQTLGFWSKWILLDFPYTFIDKEEYDKLPEDQKNGFKVKDPDIIERITTDEEMSGFLNKALEGLHRLLKNKRFSTTKGVKEVKDEWIRKSDSCMAFCMDCLEEDTNGIITTNEVKKRFSKYCRDNRVRGASEMTIGITLDKMFSVIKLFPTNFGNNTGEYAWQGIKWKKEEI